MACHLCHKDHTTIRCFGCDNLACQLCRAVLGSKTFCYPCLAAKNKELLEHANDMYKRITATYDDNERVAIILNKLKEMV